MINVIEGDIFHPFLANPWCKGAFLCQRKSLVTDFTINQDFLMISCLRIHKIIFKIWFKIWFGDNCKRVNTIFFIKWVYWRWNGEGEKFWSILPQSLFRIFLLLERFWTTLLDSRSVSIVFQRSKLPVLLPAYPFCPGGLYL